MKAKAEHHYNEKGDEQRLFYTTLLLGAGCLLTWLLMSVLL